MDAFTAQVISIIRSIPRGKVLTYGGVARAAGKPSGARQVARILHSCSKKYHLPWHRMINAKGEISLHGEGYDLQRKRLEAEGIDFTGDRIDLSLYLWQAPPGSLHGSAT